MSPNPPGKPPFANLFAAHEADPALLDDVERRLRAGGDFAAIWRPAAGWVVASAPLPGGEPDGAGPREAGIAFAEGRERMTPDGDQADSARFAAIAGLVDRTPKRLAALPGDFGLVRFRAGGEATVVCSCAGLVPFYWHAGSSILAIGTRLGDFARYLPGPFRLDPLANAIAASGGEYGPGLSSYLQDVSRIPHGHYAVLKPGRGVAVRRYWDPRPDRLARPSPALMREHEERLLALLLARLERDLDPRGGNLLTLSGGVDSSALAVLITRRLGLSLMAWSFLPAPQEPYDREMGYLSPLLDYCGIRGHWAVRAGAETRLELLPLAPRVLGYVPHPALCALPGIQREAEVRVLVGGEFADNFLGGFEAAPDWAAATSPLRLAALLGESAARPAAKRWLRLRWNSLRGEPALPQPADLRPFIRPELRAEYHAWYRQRQREVAGDLRPLRMLAQRIAEDGWVTMNWEATSALGVRRSLPFYNREMLELGYEMHSLEWGLPGEKKVLRAALRDEVPAPNLQRRDKGHWGRYLRGAQVPWTAPLPEALAAIVKPEWYPQPPRMMDHEEANWLMQLVLVAEALAEESSRAQVTLAP